jgi:hypothetical protein
MSHGHVLTLKLETVSDERRDELILGVVAAIDVLMRAGDKSSFTLTHERATARGKEQRKRFVEWEAGEPAPMLHDFGIIGTQRDMFSETLRDTIVAGVQHAIDRLDETTGEIAVAPDDDQSDDQQPTVDDEVEQRHDAAEQLLDGLREDQETQLDESKIDRMISDAVEPKKDDDQPEQLDDSETDE